MTLTGAEGQDGYAALRTLRALLRTSLGLSRLRGTPLKRTATAGLDPAEAAQLSKAVTSMAEFAPFMQPEMRLSRSYFFDHRLSRLPAELHDRLCVPEMPSDWVEGMWHPEDSLTVPLEDRDGNLLGVISIDEPLNRSRPTREDCRALELFADQCALAVVECGKLQAALEEATTDDLTGLVDRRGFLERAPGLVMQARRDGTTCSALFIDIDHFKMVNDNYGHATGDEVIATVAHTIAGRLRRGDLVARYGGEEFVAFLPDTPLDEATGLAEEIRRLVTHTRLPAADTALRPQGLNRGPRPASRFNRGRRPVSPPQRPGRGGPKAPRARSRTSRPGSQRHQARGWLYRH